MLFNSARLDSLLARFYAEFLQYEIFLENILDPGGTHGREVFQVTAASCSPFR